MFLSSCLAHRLKKLSGLTKAQCFFPKTAFGGKSAGVAGGGKNSSGMKTRFFLARVSRQGITMTWRGIGTIWFIFLRNLYILAKICTFWGDKTGLSEDTFKFFLPRQIFPPHTILCTDEA